MIWFKRWQAKRRAHFESEVLTEMAYLRSAHAADPLAAADRRRSVRQQGSFSWCVIEEAARRLSRHQGARSTASKHQMGRQGNG